VQNLAKMRMLGQLRCRPDCTNIRPLTAPDLALRYATAKVQSMPSDRCGVYVSIHGRFFLAFCAQCEDFVAASAELGSLAIAARAHRCEPRISRKLPLKVDAAEHWLRASGAIA